MYRFDFMIDPQLTPWLVEVNQSPNLSSKYMYDLKDMFERLPYGALKLKGLGKGGLLHPDTDKRTSELLVHYNDVDIG